MSTDMADVVNYELLYTLELRHPVTDEPTGTVFKIRSSVSEAVKKLQREHTNKNLERRIKGKLVKGDVLEHQELQRAAALIAEWDWGTNPKTGEPNQFGGKVPELTEKNKIEVLEKASWIYQQVVEAAADVENFSQG